MTRIDRWLWTRHVQAFAVALGALCLIYCVIDFSDRSQAYTGQDWLPWVVKLYAYRALTVAALLSPVASLMACGLTVSALRRRSEWVALTAAGLSPLRLLRPLVGSALVIGLLSAVFTDRVAVDAALKAERITAEHFHLWGAYAAYFEPKRWVRAGSAIVHFGRPLAGGGAQEVSILDLSPEFLLKRRIDAQSATLGDDGKFVLRDAKIRSFDGLRQKLVHVPRLDIDLPGAQAYFGLAPGRPEMLSSGELAKQIAARDALGLPNGEQRYEAAARLADAFAGAAGALVAAALALRARRRGHLNASLVEGVATAGALWGLAAVFKSLSLAHRAAPWICAFGPIALTATLGFAFLLRESRRPAA